MNKRPTLDLTEQGWQRVIPGAERLTDAELARRRMAQPLRPRVAQRAADHGLFSDDAKQMPLPLTGKEGSRH